MKRLFELVNRNFLISRLGNVVKRAYSDNSDHPPIITISREFGTGGSVIAQLVEKKLGGDWKVFHDEIVSSIAKETHLERKLIKQIDESRIPMIDEVVGDFFGKRYVNLSTYTKGLVKILSAIGHRGNAIIVGRGANYLFPKALKVRIVGDTEDRIKTIMKYEKLSLVKATRLVELKDEKRLEFTKAVFQHDSRKAHHYDMVIKTGPNLSVQDAAVIIYSLAKRWFKLK